VKPPRQAIPKEVETQILVASRRRCCLCYFVKGIRTERPGQIAHLMGDRDRCRFEDLVWLCLEHHNEFDSSTSQSKGLTPGEVKRYRERLYEELVSSDSVPVGPEQSGPREEPAVSISAATSYSGQDGFVWVYNPGIAEKFCLRVRGFELNDSGIELRAMWSTGEEEHVIKKGDRDWCRIMQLEPDKVRVSYSRSGLYIPSGKQDAYSQENERRRRGVRIVRLLGQSSSRDIEVAQGVQYGLDAVVFSDNREPVKERIAFGVGRETLVMPFDQDRINTLVEEDLKVRRDIEELMNKYAPSNGEAEMESLP
jgi:hypothetical protein